MYIVHCEHVYVNGNISVCVWQYIFPTSHAILLRIHTPTHMVYSPRDARAFLRIARRGYTLVRQAVPEVVAVWTVDSQVLTSVLTFIRISA